MYHKMIDLGKPDHSPEKIRGCVYIFYPREDGMTWPLFGSHSDPHIKWDEKRIAIPLEKFRETAVSALPNYRYKQPDTNGTYDFYKIWATQSFPQVSKLMNSWFDCMYGADHLEKDRWPEYLQRSMDFYSVVRFFETNLSRQNTDVLWNGLKQMISTAQHSLLGTVFSAHILGQGVFPFLMANKHEDIIYRMLDLLLYFGEVSYKDHNLETMAASLALFLGDILQGKREGYFDKRPVISADNSTALAYHSE
jgi:hypothetical protein